MKIHNIEQRSPAWYNIRKLHLTASNAQSIGNNGKGLDTYITEIMAEYYSKAEKESYTNEHIERGIELEDLARETYEIENGVETQQVGFIEMDNGSAGASPDGLVGDDGMIEIKCLNDVAHYKLIRDGIKEVDSKYLWQCQMLLLVAERKWIDLVFFNPNFDKKLIVFRIESEKEYQDKLKIGIEVGINKIKEQLII